MNIWLKEARINRGLSLAAAASEIGVSRATLVDVEDGHVPTPATAKRIADFYEQRVTDIWPVETKEKAA
jgi:DNA-binding XRE family transcriptional regulator